MSKNNRKIKQKSKYYTWIKSNGKCTFCGSNLIWIDNNKCNKIMGHIAHIISLNEEKIRSRKIMSEYINLNIYKDEHNKWKKDKNFPFFDEKDGYATNILNDPRNLILLCVNCHNIFDNRNRIKYEKYPKEVEEIDSLFRLDNDLNKYYNNLYDFINKRLLNIKRNNYEFFIGNDKEYLNNISEIFELFNYINSNDENFWKNIGNNIDYIKKGFHECKIVIESFNFIDEKKDEIFKFYYANIGKKFSEINLKEFKNEIKDFLEYYIISVKFDLESKICFLNFRKKYHFLTSKNICSKKELNDKLKNDKSYNNLANVYYQKNYSEIDDSFKERKEYKIIKKIILDSSSSYLSNKSKHIEPISIAFFSRWGSGKTSLIRTLMDDIKEYFNYVEINLWNISNLLERNNTDKDNSFVRLISKNAITEIIRNDEYVDYYFDINKESNASWSGDYKEDVIDSMLGINKDKSSNIFESRSKFIDQFITKLQKIINTNILFTNKGTIFVFDDIDRISDEETIVSMLDSIVTFLNLKNVIYIFPVDDSKIIKSLINIKKVDNPYNYINKYFNYCIKSSYTPKMNIKSIFKSLNSFNKNNLPEEIIDKISDSIDHSYRSVKDFYNSYNFDLLIFKNIDEKNNYAFTKELFSDNCDMFVYESIALSKILQMKYPLILDFISSDINILRKIIMIFSNIELSEIVNEKNSLKLKINDTKKISIKDIKEFFDELFSTDILIREENDFSEFIEIREINYNNVYNFKKILEKFNAKEYNDKRILLLWQSITLSNVENEDIIDYFKSSKCEMYIEKEFIDENLDKDSMEMIDKKVVENYFNKLHVFYNLNIIDDNRINNYLENIVSTIFIKNIKKIFNNVDFLFKNKFFITKIYDLILNKKMSSDECLKLLTNFINNFDMSSLSKENKKIILDHDSHYKIIDNLDYNNMHVSIIDDLSKILIIDNKNNINDQEMVIKNKNISLQFIMKINEHFNFYKFEFFNIINHIDFSENILEIFFHKILWKEENIIKFILFYKNNLIDVIERISLINNCSSIDSNKNLIDIIFGLEDIIELLNSFDLEKVDELYNMLHKKNNPSTSVINKFKEIIWNKTIEKKEDFIIFLEKFILNNLYDIENSKIIEKIYNKIFPNYKNDFFIIIDSLNKNCSFKIILKLYELISNNFINEFNINNLDLINKYVILEKNISKWIHDNIHYLHKIREYINDKFNKFDIKYAFEGMKVYDGVKHDHLIKYNMIFNENLNYDTYNQIFEEKFGKSFDYNTLIGNLSIYIEDDEFELNENNNYDDDDETILEINSEDIECNDFSEIQNNKINSYKLLLNEIHKLNNNDLRYLIINNNNNYSDYLLDLQLISFKNKLIKINDNNKKCADEYKDIFEKICNNDKYIKDHKIKYSFTLYITTREFIENSNNFINEYKKDVEEYTNLFDEKIIINDFEELEKYKFIYKENYQLFTDFFDDKNLDKISLLSFIKITICHFNNLLKEINDKILRKFNDENLKKFLSRYKYLENNNSFIDKFIFINKDINWNNIENFIIFKTNNKKYSKFISIKNDLNKKIDEFEKNIKDK